MHTTPDTSLDSRLDSRLDTVVIGAGQAGLALAYHLRRDCRRFVVLEAADRVGDSWRRRWDSLTLFTPRRYDALPGRTFPGDPEGSPGKDEMADSLDAYASQFDLPIQLGRRVTSVRRDGAGGFIVDTSHETFTAGQVVVATGGFTGPVTPSSRGGWALTSSSSTAARTGTPRRCPRARSWSWARGTRASRSRPSSRRQGAACRSRSRRWERPRRSGSWAGACSGGSSGWA